MFDEASKPNHGEDLPEEEVQAAKKKSRWNALILGLVFVLVTLLPSSFKPFAPLILLLPLAKSLLDRLRRSAEQSGMPPAGHHHPDVGKDLYSAQNPKSPRDSKDPRRYKPIG